MAELALSELIQSVERRVRSRRPGLDLDLDVDPNLPGRYDLGDSALARVLALLVEHAAASGDDERVSLAVSGAGRDGPRTRLRFEVRDHAPPRDPASLVSPEKEGSLGPALFRRLSAPLTQEVGAHRSALTGSTWWFVVAMRPTDVSGVRPYVLVVDDNAINRKVASHLLGKLGCQVDVVDDGRQAVLASRDGHYDLILMDCQMPGMDGWTATAAIRRSEGRQRHTPIVACTSLAYDENRTRCLDSGMDGFMTKPLDVGALQRVVTDWVRAS